LCVTIPFYLHQGNINSMINIKNIPNAVLIIVGIGSIGIISSFVDVFITTESIDKTQLSIDFCMGVIGVGLIFRNKIIYYLNLIVLALQIAASTATVTMVLGLGFGHVTNSPSEIILLFSLTLLWFLLYFALRTRKVREWIETDSNHALQPTTESGG